MKIRNYLITQIKRVSRLMPRVMLISLLFAVVVLSVGRVVINNSSYSNNKLKYCIGVMGLEEDSLLTLAVRLVESIDDIQYMLDIKEYDTEEEAMNALRKNEITAYAVIPADFFDSIYYLSNDSRIVYYSGAGEKGITNVLMDEVTAFLSEIIISSESGVITLWELLSEAGYSSAQLSQISDELVFEYARVILNRSALTENTVLGLSSGLSTYTYYLVSFTLFYVLLLSFSGLSFFSGRRPELNRLVAAEGVNCRSQVTAEIGAFFLMNLVNSCLLFIVTSAVLSTGILSIPEMGEELLSGYAAFSVKLIPVIFMFSSFEFLIFELFNGVVGQMLAAFFVFFGTGYASGYFYPRSFLPETLMKIGDALPTGTAFSYAAAIINKASSGKLLPVMLLYSACFILCSIGLRRVKLVNGGKK